jgi:phosphoserine aminotransferase
MICFYPGPSQLSPGVDRWMNEAVTSGILTRNHRSQPFMDLYQDTKIVIREKLKVPDNYEVVFTSSATECWEIISQSFARVSHYHFYCGAFGEKWYDYALQLNPEHYAQPFGAGQFIKPRQFSEEPCVLCLTHCETCNGTLSPVSEDWGKLNPEAIIAVDATSSLGGVDENISHADIWFASVQKCFGLPSGLSVMLVSQKAQKHVFRYNDRGHYNSLVRVLDNARKNQTSYTPNILGIFLLNRVLQSRPPIPEIDQLLKSRMAELEHLINEADGLDFLIENKEVRSSTVATIKSDEVQIEKIKAKALDNGFILGNGYGKHKYDTFRIANFPAITQDQWNALLNFLRNITD